MRNAALCLLLALLVAIVNADDSISSFAANARPEWNLKECLSRLDSLEKAVEKMKMTYYAIERKPLVDEIKALKGDVGKLHEERANERKRADKPKPTTLEKCEDEYNNLFNKGSLIGREIRLEKEAFEKELKKLTMSKKYLQAKAQKAQASAKKL